MKLCPILALTLFIAIDFMPCEKLCNGSGEYMTLKGAAAIFKHISSYTHYDLSVKDFHEQMIKF